MIETYQHKTIFSASKPAVQIFALQQNMSSTYEKDSEPIDTLLFKDNNEQNFWYKILNELWSGVSIAEEQYDKTISYKISTHIALIDVLTNLDYNENKKGKSGNNQVIKS